MKIVLDLQALQSQGSRHRGIGRYAAELAKALLRRGGETHDMHVVVNAAFPDYVQDIKLEFADLLAPDKLHAFSIPTQVNGLHPRNAWRMRSAEQLREAFIVNLRPDRVWVPSMFEGLSDNIVTSLNQPALAAVTAVTIHDLIPLVLAEQYLGNPIMRDWYYRKLQAVKNADMGLAVSEYSRQEAIRLLGLNAEQVFTVTNAVSEHFRPRVFAPDYLQALQARFGINRPFILYSGGAESRKNVDRLIAAYAQQDLAVRMQYQLVIAGHLQPWQQQQIIKVRQQHGLFETDVVMTGFVTDEELIALYNTAHLFMFPSLYEGFGLPVLEAMACGAPTLAANNTSLPEVVGWQEALFDGESIPAIAAKMHQGLFDTGFRAALTERAQQQVKRFSWEVSAQQTLDAFAAQHAQQQRHVQVAMPSRSAPQRLALVYSCLPDGDATVQRILRLLPSLARFYEIDMITDYPFSGSAWVNTNVSVRSRQWLRDHATDYQRRLYVVTPDHADAELLALLEAQPGTVLLASDEIEPQWRESAWGTLTLEAPPQDEAVCAASLLGQTYFEALEYFHTEHPAVREQALLERLARMQGFRSPSERKWLTFTKMAGAQQQKLLEYLYVERLPTHQERWRDAFMATYTAVSPTEQDWLAVAQCIAENRPSWACPTAGSRALFYDVSAFARQDQGTGVHRVTRKILSELFANPPAGFRIEPIYADEGQFRYARQMTHTFLGLSTPALADEVVDFHRDDVYLCIDMELRMPQEMEQTFQHIRALGVSVNFLIHDILAVKLPERYFDDFVRRNFRAWFDAVVRVADGLICTTATVQQELAEWLDENPPKRVGKPRLGNCTLGADIRTVTDGAALPAESPEHTALLERFKTQPAFLMVSTLEPRKGYTQALQAFERLWAQGVDVDLVIVGKQGWNVEALTTALSNHVELGKRLHWLKFVSDGLLAQLYASSQALLIASEGEGFGLPLIEAAQYELPVIARHLPVFRELAGDHVFYFEGNDPADLASAVQHWLSLKQQGKEPKAQGIQWATWQDSAECIKAFLLKQGG